MKTLNSIEEVEAYLGSQECKSTETPLTVWNARQILLIRQRLRLLSDDSLKTDGLSDVGKRIMQMIREENRPKAGKHVYKLESYAESISDGRYNFDFASTPKKKIYRSLAQLIPYMDDNQQQLFTYICTHSNLEIQPSSLKNAVYYWLKKKV